MGSNWRRIRLVVILVTAMNKRKPVSWHVNWLFNVSNRVRSASVSASKPRWLCSWCFPPSAVLADASLPARSGWRGQQAQAFRTRRRRTSAPVHCESPRQRYASGPSSSSKARSAIPRRMFETATEFGDKAGAVHLIQNAGAAAAEWVRAPMSADNRCGAASRRPCDL